MIQLSFYMIILNWSSKSKHFSLSKLPVKHAHIVTLFQTVTSHNPTVTGLQTSLDFDTVLCSFRKCITGRDRKTLTTPMAKPSPSRPATSQMKTSIAIRALPLLKALDNMAARHPQASATGKWCASSLEMRDQYVARQTFLLVCLVRKTRKLKCQAFIFLVFCGEQLSFQRS